MKKIIILFISLISIIGLSSAISLTLNSGEKLNNSNWSNLSSVLNKVDISGGNINIDGKFNINGKVIDINTGKILGECDADKHWDNTSGTCISNTKSCNVTNGAGTQTWSSGSWLACQITSCDNGYHKEGSSCVANSSGTPEKFDLSGPAFPITSVNLSDKTYSSNIDPKKIFDGNINTFNSGPWNQYSASVTIDFGSPRYVGKAIWKSRSGTMTGGMWGNGEPANSFVKVYGSNNNSNWTETGSYGPYQDSPNYLAITVSSSMHLPYRYFKIVSMNTNSIGYPMLSELELYGFDE